MYKSFARSEYTLNDNTYCPAVVLNLDQGKYLFELWGARSGDDYYRTGYALGGYASGAGGGELAARGHGGCIEGIGGGKQCNSYTMLSPSKP